MGAKLDIVRKQYAPLLDKTLENALAHRIMKEFPRIGGQRIGQLCARMILEVVEAHLRPQDQVRHGQVLWMAVDVNDPPSRGKTIAQTNLVPVVLDLHTAQDTEAIIERKSHRQRRLDKAVRLSFQAFRQGGLLSNSDLSALLGCDNGEVSAALAEHERQSETVVPRRATIHDVGTGLTHKRIICLKRYRDGKPAHEIARETHHSLEAVDRYLGQYDRVRHCRRQGLSAEQTAYTLSCSPALVRQYLAIDEDLEANHG